MELTCRTILLLPRVTTDLGNTLWVPVSSCVNRADISTSLQFLNSKSLLYMLPSIEKWETGGKGVSFPDHLEGWLIFFLARAMLYHEEKLTLSYSIISGFSLKLTKRKKNVVIKVSDSKNHSLINNSHRSLFSFPHDLCQALQTFIYTFPCRYVISLLFHRE